MPFPIRPCDNKQDTVAKKIEGWKGKLSDLRVRNAAAEEDERLPDSDFMMDVGLQEDLREQGKKRAAVVGAAARKDAACLQVVRERVRELCLLSQSEPAQELLSLPEHIFMSTLTAEDHKRWKEAGPVVKVPGVSSYAVRRPTAEEALRLRKARFLRQVEQAEWAERPQEGRGVAIKFKKWNGRMAGRFSLDTVTSDGEKLFKFSHLPHNALFC